MACSLRKLYSQSLYRNYRPRSVPQSVPIFSPQKARTVRNTATVTTNAQPTKRSKWARRIFWATFFASLGYYTGQRYLQAFMSPAAPGTPEDARRLEELRRLVEYLPIVQKLREDPQYKEWEAYEVFSEEQKMPRLTSGPLKGSRGLALQRIFWNEEEKECVNVVYFGHGLDGWLTIVHGGLLATVLDETLARVVPSHSRITANLKLDYRAPVATGEFYTIHTRLDPDRSTERKAFVTGEIRSLMGKLCVESEALFVRPKKLVLRNVNSHF
ncbi:HotDog domain-containing protein [Talaromyces proteolyticus]|uniref:HotDog domain-containing protein n=1 Tax=Talaromyces proteolyticus TaxID=1131652 RepID=A0AAD4KMC7_9EURO|nr:HotDog domain-containing protein [Talaromyces proteolyticus]KAH8695071.1 HotDog domain-containing protein [Talaromyces proteolyticus]